MTASLGPRRSRWNLDRIAVALLCLGSTAVWPLPLGTVETTRTEIWGIDRDLITRAVTGPVSRNEYPQDVVVETRNQRKNARIHYNIDEGLQAAIQKQLDRYRPDYGMFVAIDPDTGHVLAMANHRRDGRLDDNMTLKSTYPSASVFKIITAAAAVDGEGATANTVYPYNGKTTTLYKKNVLKHSNNKWTRHDSLKKSFAKSANTAFARIGIYEVGGEQLYDYAVRFGFNRVLDSDIKLNHSAIEMDLHDEWSIAETASGYTRGNTMSPLHGALIAASVANGGVMLDPVLVDSITDESGIILYEARDPGALSVISEDSAYQLRKIMQETVKSGSASKPFRGFFKGDRKDIEVGGKTGSLTGFEPRGKYDWFVGYAMRGDRKIAFATLCINKDYWYVKSAQLARSAIEYYFDRG